MKPAFAALVVGRAPQQPDGAIPLTHRLTFVDALDATTADDARAHALHDFGNTHHGLEVVLVIAEPVPS